MILILDLCNGSYTDDLTKILDECNISMPCKSCKMASNSHLLVMVDLSNTKMTFSKNKFWT